VASTRKVEENSRTAVHCAPSIIAEGLEKLGGEGEKYGAGIHGVAREGTVKEMLQVEGVPVEIYGCHRES